MKKYSTAKQRRSWHRELSAHWSASPITYCEIRFDGCFGTYGLAPAHSRKRRHIENKEQYFEVAAACLNCHRILDEKMSHQDMEQTVKAVIAKRNEQIESNNY